jgi:hypothetical protein
VSPEIQYHHVLHHRKLHYKSFQKKYEVQNLEKLLQTVKVMVLAAENKCDNLQHVIKTDVMLSPGTTSLGIINVGRGWIPFHGPTIRKSTGPR